MIYRMSIAIGSLISGLVALYLHLWKLGLAGTLACAGGSHGCEYIQGSRYGWFMGVDVALIGTFGYAALVVVALLGTSPRWEDEKWPTLALMALIFPALAFTVRLKYAEFPFVQPLRCSHDSNLRGWVGSGEGSGQPGRLAADPTGSATGRVIKASDMLRQPTGRGHRA